MRKFLEHYDSNQTFLFTACDNERVFYAKLSLQGLFDTCCRSGFATTVCHKVTSLKADFETRHIKQQDATAICVLFFFTAHLNMAVKKVNKRYGVVVEHMDWWLVSSG